MEERKELDNGVGQSSFRRKVARLYFKKAVFHPLPILFRGFLQQGLLGCPKYFPELLKHRGLSGPPCSKTNKILFKGHKYIAEVSLDCVNGNIWPEMGLLGMLKRFWIKLVWVASHSLQLMCFTQTWLYPVSLLRTSQGGCGFCWLPPGSQHTKTHL